MSVLKPLWLRPKRSGGWLIIWYSSVKRVPFMLPGKQLLLCEEMMSFTNYSRNWRIDTKIELVDIQDFFELAYELVMLHPWLILSLLTEKMNLDSQSLLPLNLHRDLLWILGQDPSFANSLHRLKRRNYLCLMHKLGKRPLDSITILFLHLSSKGIPLSLIICHWPYTIKGNVCVLYLVALYWSGGRGGKNDKHLRSADIDMAA